MEEPDTAVGVVDSVYMPPDYFQDSHRVKRTVDVTDSDTDFVDNHGNQVAYQIATYTKNPEFHFYRVFPDEGRPRDSHLMLAIGRAIEYGEVDVLNMSVGADHIGSEDRACTRSASQCRLCELAKKAVHEHGINLVAAAGNQPFAGEVCCPALSDYVIAVGGIQYSCGGKMPDTMGFTSAMGEVPPPNAYWIVREDDNGEEHMSGPFCSDRGCGPGLMCTNNRTIELWEHNVTFTDRKPDTIAPAHMIWLYNDRKPELFQGTSFSAPLVSAGIIATLELEEELDELEVPYTTPEIRSSIRNSGRNFPKISQPQFSMFAFANQLRQLRNKPALTVDDTELYQP